MARSRRAGLGSKATAGAALGRLCGVRPVSYRTRSGGLHCPIVLCIRSCGSSSRQAGRQIGVQL
eukprot:4658881-Alexandrium_andersonii.AAC.1